MRSQYRSDHVVDRQTIVARTHFRQGLTWAEAATSATADVIGAKERTLSARISLDELGHGSVWIDCRRQAHKSSLTSFHWKSKKQALCRERLSTPSSSRPMRSTVDLPIYSCRNLLARQDAVLRRFARIVGGQKQMPRF